MVLLPRDRARLTSSIERRRISPLPASPASPTGCCRPGLWDADGLSCRCWDRGRVSGVGLSSAQSRPTSAAVSRWSVFECWRSPGTVMVPRDFGEVHGCNSSLQRKMPDQMTSGWHYRALEGTQGHSLDGGPPPEIFLWACGHLAELSHAAQSLFSGPTGTVRSQPPSGRIPADAYGQPRITTYNSSLLLTPTYNYSTSRLQQNTDPNQLPITPSILYT